MGVLSVHFQTEKPIELSIVPNPAREQAQLSWSFPADQLVIVNTSGQVIYRQPLTEETRSLQLPIHQIPTGIYWLQLEGETTVTTKRLLIQ